jgi:ecotin
MSMITVVVAMALLGTSPEADTNLKAYPPAKEGQVRLVLKLPEMMNEELMRVELQVGKVVEVDAVNRFFFAGKLMEETLEGWGFPRYVLPTVGPLAGTRIGVDPDAPKVTRFITLGGEPFLIRYNSRLPVVVYVPAGMEVKYRVWKAPSEVQAVKEG